MTARLRNARIRLNALLDGLAVRRLYKPGATRQKVLSTIAKHGELQIQAAKHKGGWKIEQRVRVTSR